MVSLNSMRMTPPEFVAKHQSMRKQKCHVSNLASEIIRPPAFPMAGNKLFERIGAAVGASRGYSLTNIELARLIGRSESTASSWFGVYSQPHLVSWLCLLEHLPPPDRHRVVDELCRDLPLLDHPRLRHNPVTVGALKDLLAQSAGLTFVSGGTDSQRTFLLTALGHTFCRVDRRHRTPAGLDLNEPSWFVPIETLMYGRNSHRPAQSVEAIRGVWPDLRTSRNPLILLNGVWSAAPELRQDIVQLGVKKHVIVTAQNPPTTTELAPDAGPAVHLLTVSVTRENPTWLVVDVQRR